MLNSTNVECFLSLCKTLNFTETARELFLSQQAVSRQINQLEEELGIILFIRTHNYVKVTPEGKRFERLFYNFNQELAECIHICKQEKRAREATLRVGFLDWSNYGEKAAEAHAEMNSLVSDFKFEGEMHSSQKLKKLLLTRQIDAAVMFKHHFRDLSPYYYFEICRKNMELIVSENLYKKEQGDLNRLLASPLLIEEESYHILKDAGKLDYYQGKESDVFFKPNRDSIFMSVELGQGIAFGSEMSHIENRKFVLCPLDVEVELICIWLKESETDLVRSYAECLQKVYIKKDRL